MFTVTVKTDPRRHVQDPRTTPWIIAGSRLSKTAADALASDLRAEGETVRVVRS